MRNIKFRGKLIDKDEWVHGYYHLLTASRTHCIDVPMRDFDNSILWHVRPNTVGQFTGLYDKRGQEIYEDDIVQLTLPNGEVRNFVVDIDTVVREVVSHPDFDAPTSKVAITGVVFKWNNYELFPCVDENGKHDNEDMIVVGNIWDNPELLKLAFSKGGMTSV